MALNYNWGLFGMFGVHAYFVVPNMNEGWPGWTWKAGATGLHRKGHCVLCTVDGGVPTMAFFSNPMSAPIGGIGVSH